MDRQKKLLLFGAAWVSALLLTWLFAAAAAPKKEKMLRVVVASRDMPAGTLLKKTDVKLADYPERDVPKGVSFKVDDALSRVLMVPVNTNEPILSAKVT